MKTAVFQFILLTTWTCQTGKQSADLCEILAFVYLVWNSSLLVTPLKGYYFQDRPLSAKYNQLAKKTKVHNLPVKIEIFLS